MISEGLHVIADGFETGFGVAGRCGRCCSRAVLTGRASWTGHGRDSREGRCPRRLICTSPSVPVLAPSSQPCFSACTFRLASAGMSMSYPCRYATVPVCFQRGECALFLHQRLLEIALLRLGRRASPSPDGAGSQQQQRPADPTTTTAAGLLLQRHSTAGSRCASPIRRPTCSKHMPTATPSARPVPIQ